MVDVTVIQSKPRRKRKRKYPKGTTRPNQSPRNLERVREIVRLRKKKLSWQEIADEIGTTRLAPRLLYKRWYEWMKDND